MLSPTQQQLLTSSIQQRNDTGEPSLGKDVFEVIKQVSKDWADFLENGEYAFDSGFEVIFETFLAQYNP